MQHVNYILACYALVLGGVILLTAWVLYTHQKIMRLMQEK